MESSSFEKADNGIKHAVEVGRVSRGRRLSDGGLNRSMQHLDFNNRGEDVAHEAPDEDPVHRS